jgi:DNA-binding IscR family transcriptional regulator
MKLNKKLELGIKAVELLKTLGTDPVRTQDLAVKIGTTTNFLEQVMRDLRIGGIVTATKGPKGGYCLANQTPVTALQVAQAVGRTFGNEKNDSTPTGRLALAVTQAYQNTVL